MLINNNTYNSYLNYGTKKTASNSADNATQANYSQTNLNKVFPPLLMEVNGKKSIVSMTSERGSVNAVKDDSYTDDNPIMLVKGMDSHGNEYEEKIDPRKVNPKNANSVEMAALTAYMLSTGQIEEKPGINAFVFPHANYRSQNDIFEKIDFAADVSRLAAWQKGRDTHDQYVFFTDALMKMMDYVSENQKNASEKEYTSRKTETKTEIATNQTGESVMRISTPTGMINIKIGEPMGI